VAGDTLRFGRREFEVLTGGGHAPEQVMLLSRADGIFFSSDQVLARISPNVSVSAIDPEGDPLGLYMRSLDALRSVVPGDVLVLPGHNLPFRGLHDRISELQHHHELRCAEILKACRHGPKSAAELVPVIFHRPLDPHQTSFAFSEVLAHVNYMWRQSRLTLIEQSDGVTRAVAC
jgi:glyoxylase-like metal-dependent hydrolase (beta-lactamase superfamily II)